MELDNRKITILSFLVICTVIGYVFFLGATEVAALFRIGGANVLWGLHWNIVGGALSVLVGFAIFLGAALNNRATEFSDEVVAEVRKTVWPTGQETASSTVVVSIMVAIAALLLFALDWVWGIVFNILI